MKASTYFPALLVFTRNTAKTAAETAVKLLVKLFLGGQSLGVMTPYATERTTL